MKLVLLSALGVATSAMTIAPEVMSAFKDFQVKYGKTYTNDVEWAKRMGVFAENFEKLSGQNRDHMLMGGQSVFGITKFSDLTAEEFKTTYLTYKPRENAADDGMPIMLNGTLADHVDWRTKGAVTAVKDQGQCGSCWAFSATEAIESYAFLAGQPLQELSAQQINSCDEVDQGCNGGNSESAYEYVVKAGGLELQSDYPYTSGEFGEDGKCKDKGKTKKAVSISGYTSIQRGEKNLKAALNNGPVSVCVAADAFQSYNGGILRSCPGQIDHCVQAVGYNTEDRYWIVRNSWATNWGEDGYIRVAMGHNLCKISNDVTYPYFN